MPKVHVTITLEPADLQRLDAYCANHGVGRGAGVLELLNLAAGGVAHETSTTRIVSPAVLGSESEKQRRLTAAMSLHPSIRRGLGQSEPTPEPLGPGERRVDPFEGG